MLAAYSPRSARTGAKARPCGVTVCVSPCVCARAFACVGSKKCHLVRGCTARSPSHSFVHCACAMLGTLRTRTTWHYACSHRGMSPVGANRHASCLVRLIRSFGSFIWFVRLFGPFGFVRVLHRLFACLLACLLAVSSLWFDRFCVARACALDSVLESAHFLAAAGRVGEAAAVLDKARLPLDASRPKRESA